VGIIIELIITIITLPERRGGASIDAKKPLRESLGTFETKVRI
jgi:hypothetical protein